MKELEVQYQQARYEGQRKAQEQEANKSKQLTSQVSTFSQTETELRSQLNIYVEKFKQVSAMCDNIVKVWPIPENRQDLATSNEEFDPPETTSKAQKTRWDFGAPSPGPHAFSNSLGSSSAIGTGVSSATPMTGTTTTISSEEMRTTFAAMLALGLDGELIEDPIWISTSSMAHPKTPENPETAMPLPICTSLPKSHSSTSASAQAPKASTSLPQLSLQIPHSNVLTEHKRKS